MNTASGARNGDESARRGRSLMNATEIETEHLTKSKIPSDTNGALDTDGGTTLSAAFVSACMSKKVATSARGKESTTAGFGTKMGSNTKSDNFVETGVDPAAGDAVATNKHLSFVASPDTGMVIMVLATDKNGVYSGGVTTRGAKIVTNLSVSGMV